MARIAQSWNLQSRLLVAIQNSDEIGVKRLVEESSVDLDCTFNIGGIKRPAVCLCVQRGNVRLLNYLIEKGCSINQSDSLGHSPLHIACAYSYEKMVETLIANRAHVNAITPQGHTPLHLASKTDSIEIVRRLCDAGAEIDRPDNERKTPLLNACIQGHLPVADYLLSRGADVNICSPCESTPLLFAASMHHVGLISRLLDAGALINRQNIQGESALHAVLRGQNKEKSQALSLLLCHLDIDLKVRTVLGHTPLHLAAILHDKRSAIKLLRAGCEISSKDKLGLTPLFYALREGDQELVRLLMAAGIKLEDESWLNDVVLTKSIKNPDLMQWLISVGRQCPKLTEICRSALRVHGYGGQRPYDSIDTLALPLTLKQFLLFEGI
ncbi:ankyrin repeat domain [Chamberlinius hualienensis]